MARALLLIVLATIPVYLAGLLAMLFGFGFVPGWWLSVAAFVTSAVTSVLVQFEAAFRKELCRPIPFPHSQQYAPHVWWGAKICLVLFLVNFAAHAAASGPYGELESGGPIFAPRDVYRLNNHGKKTDVSRERYALAGTTFVLTWHSGAIGFSLFQLYVVLTGELPPGFRRTEEPAQANRA